MSKTRIFALSIVALLLIAFLTNPRRDKHEEALRAKATEILTNQLEYGDSQAVDLGMTLYGDRIVDEFIRNSIQVENYYLFSLTKIRWQSELHVIGGGAFGTVWLSPKLDEEADKIIHLLKDL